VKTKQHKSSYFMKGVSDTIYLAFIGILTVGGTVYIYNDINANKASIAGLASSEQSASVVAQEVSQTIENNQESKITAAKVDEKTASIETAEAAVIDTPVINIEQTEQAAVTAEAEVKASEVTMETKSEPQTAAIVEVKQNLAETTAIKENTTASPAAEPAIENTATETTTTETVQAVSAQKTETTAQVADTPVVNAHVVDNRDTTKMNPAAMNNSQPMPMPVPNMHGFMPPQYDYQMHQAARYMPQPYMQDPYYGDNRNYQATYEQKQYELQQYDQQRAAQQRRQYQNTNNPYPEQYNPWNPGRFY
jgi:hypothetical protein